MYKETISQKSEAIIYLKQYCNLIPRVCCLLCFISTNRSRFATLELNGKLSRGGAFCQLRIKENFVNARVHFICRD